MFWKRKPQWPITIEDRNWIDQNLEFLMEVLGTGHFKALRTILPTKDFFDRKFEGNESDAHFVFSVVSRIMDIEEGKVTLAFFSDGPVEKEDGTILTTPEEENGLWSGAAGWYQRGNGETTIAIERRKLANTTALIATIAHELAHEILLGENRISENDEHLTDLVAIVYGFGIFLGNAHFNFNSFSDGNMSGWQMNQQGYMPEQAIAYAMARLSLLRNEDTRYRQYLDKPIKKYFTRSWDGLKLVGLKPLATASSIDEGFRPEANQHPVPSPENMPPIKPSRYADGELNEQLITACQQGDFLIAEQLLQHGADANAMGQFGFTALKAAIMSQQIKLVHSLLEAGADVNLHLPNEISYQPPLNEAAKANFPEAVNLLLEYGADLETRCFFGYTPLMRAVEENAAETVEVLLSHGANIEAKIAEATYAKTPICIAVLKNHLELVEFLAKAGAKNKPLRRIPRHTLNPKTVKWLKLRKMI